MPASAALEARTSASAGFKRSVFLIQWILSAIYPAFPFCFFFNGFFSISFLFFLDYTAHKSSMRTCKIRRSDSSCILSGETPETLVYTETGWLFQMPFLFPAENTIYFLYLWLVFPVTFLPISSPA